MKIKWNKILWIALLALMFSGACFLEPVFASDTEGEYIGAIGPGESISSRGITYAIYQISAASIPSHGGWCSNCATSSCFTYEKADAVTSTYSVYVDGYPVLNYGSTRAGSDRIDLSAYTNKDAVISLPNSYVVTQTIRCVGGNMNNGDSVSPCGYSYTRRITVSGSLQLYGNSKIPEVVTNPSAVSGGTDQNAVFTVSGNKVVGYRWQKVTDAGITDLRDGTDEDGVTYSGCATAQLVVSHLRSRLNGASFRCVLIGENGDEVATEAAMVTVSDVSGPKVQLSCSPKEKTEGPVTINIVASDPDSGLAPSPYYYQGSAHESASFSVTQNGTYEVKVTDKTGNTTTASIAISNIQPKQEKTETIAPKTETTQIPQPVMNVTTTSPANTTSSQPVVTQSSKKQNETVAETKAKESTDKQTAQKKNSTTAKNVNIRNLTAGIYGKQEDAAIGKQEDEEEVLEETMLSEAPEEEMVPEHMEETQSSTDPVMTMIFLGVGLLVLLATLFLALLFPVRVENADELGNWHFCAMKVLRYRKEGWELQLGLLLEDFDSLRLKFGMLFIALIGNNHLKILTSEGEKMTITEVSQDLILHYHQMGGIK